MGSFYTNVTLRHEDQQAVAEALRELERTAYVTPPAHGAIVVFDQATDENDPEELARLTALLSGRLRCAALGVLNHDDDVLVYVLCENGRERDRYDSRPGYFSGEDAPPSGGDADALRAAFGAGDRAELERVLHPRGEGPTFATDQHQALVAALGTNGAAVGTGYGYVSRGELPEGIAEDELAHVRAEPAPPSGKRARGAAGKRDASPPAADPRAAIRDAFIARFSRPERPSPELWAILNDQLPPSYAARESFTRLELVGLVMRYVAPRVPGQTEQRFRFDERLTALFGVDQATMPELIALLGKHVTPA